MTDTSNARAEILARIQSANRRVSGAAQPKPPDFSWEALPRSYVRKESLQPEEILRLLEERLTDYGARVFHAKQEELPGMIEHILSNRQKERILLPAGVSPQWLPRSVTFQQDDDLSSFELNVYEGVLTSATLAIAATGTIILQNSAGQGRRALSLVPDYHLCIVLAEQVVESVPEAFERLAPTSTRSTTFISGPSATADIEMTRIQGVHGPRFLDVVLATVP
jgi:L-lactate dehydrogenase complex protein LldG